ncbi:hypothetical protein HYS48_04590 [Candidatus Woesearchaeota archaeon]|nr:hypothetical protein [Candidatus Woesearchaeota archaeon]
MWWLFLALLFALPVVSAELIIHEILYNPLGDDNNREFVEVFHNEASNLSSFIIADTASNDTLQTLQYLPGQFSLIVEEGFDFSSITNASVYSAGSTIGNGLSNDGETLTLYDPDGNLLASATYSNTLANGNGFSLEVVDGVWLESLLHNGTPGMANSAGIPAISPIPNVSNNSNATNASNPNKQDCTIHLSVQTDKLVYLNEEQVKILFDVTDESMPYSIEYWVEDLRGIIVKEKRNTSNTNAKYFTPEITESDKALQAKGKLYSECNNAGRREAESIFTVLNNATQIKNSTSFIVIKEILLEENSTAFGKQFEILLEIYKGDTRKSVVEVFVVNQDKQKVSDVSKFSAREKFTVYEISLPMQMKQGCNEGQHTLLAKGLDGIQEMPIFVEKGENCERTEKSEAVKEKQEEMEKPDTSPSLLRLVEGPSQAMVGKPFSVVVAIENPSDEARNFIVWSYIYRGSKSYSGEREGNKQETRVEAKSREEVELWNTVKDAKDGIYKIKVRALQERRKTPLEITNDISLSRPEELQEEEIPALQKAGEAEQENQVKVIPLEPVTGSIVLESKTNKLKRHMLLILLGLCFLTIVVLVMREK